MNPIKSQVLIYSIIPILSLFLIGSSSLLSEEEFPFNFTSTVSNCNEVTFNVTGGVPIAQSWDFGDGFSDTSPSPTHFYGQPGTYTVCLTATDGTQTNTQCNVVTISQTDCCSGPVTTTTDLGQCCFSLAIDNPYQQFFTGVKVTLPSPYVFNGGVNFNFSNWGLAAAPTNMVELGYIGTTHMPMQNNLPVMDFCLSQATSGPIPYTIDLMIGPNVICTITDTLDCFLCIPAIGTASTTLEAKVNPAASYGYIERGTDIIADKNTDEIYVLGVTGAIDELGNQSNMFFQHLDNCGEQSGEFMVVSGTPIPLPQLQYPIIDAKFIDVRSQGLTLISKQVAFVAVCTVRKGAQTDYVIVPLESDGTAIAAIEQLNLTPEYEEIEDIIRVGVNDWVLVGSCRSLGGGVPATLKMFGVRINMVPPFNSTEFLSKSYFNMGVNFDRTSGVAVTHDPSTNLLYFTGKAPNDQLSVVVTDMNLVLQNWITMDVDNFSNSAETGKSIKIIGGELIVWGDIQQGGFQGSINRIFMTKLQLPLPSAPASPTVLVNKIYDIPGGDELVSEFIVDINGEYVVGGTARAELNISTPGSPPNSRPFLLKTDAFGNYIWSNIYQNAHHLEAIDEAPEGYVMVGQLEKSGSSNPFPASTFDAWVGKVDRKGVMAECDCFDPVIFDGVATTGQFSQPTMQSQSIAPAGAFMDIASVMTDTIQDFCFPGCATGGPGNPCPGGCCSYISGYKFMDGQNGPGSCDGVQDLPFEPNICGWTIELFDPVTNLVVQTKQTNSAGFYAFGNICAGTYQVREVNQNCWIQSAPSAGVHNITVGAADYHFNVNFANCPEIDCDRHLNANLTTVSLTPDCIQTVSIDNNSCFDLGRVVISTNNGVGISNPTPQAGYQLCALYPPTSNQICIEAAGGGPISTGSSLSLVDVSLTNICSYRQVPQDVVVDYFIELPCGVDRSFCSDTLMAQCPINCPTKCDSTSASYIETPDTTDICCFNINLTNQLNDYFTKVQIRPLSPTTFVPGSMNLNTAQWSMVQNTTSMVELLSNTGNICSGSSDRFIPVGNFTPVKVCLQDYISSPQYVVVDWIGCDGDICSDTLTMECDRCIEIVNDTLSCDGADLQYCFDFRNVWSKDVCRIDVDYLLPTGATATPSSTTISPCVMPGQSSGTYCWDIDNVGNADSLKIAFQVFEDSCCWCFTDTLCYEIPVCCDTCESIQYMVTDTIVNGDTCCYNVDVYHCVDSFFTGIKAQSLGSIYMGQQSAANDWFMNNPLNNCVTYHPRPTPPHSTYIPAGWNNNKMQFCLNGYDTPADVPQEVVLKWLSGSDTNIICEDTLTFFCQPPDTDTCVTLVDTSFVCINDSTWQLDLGVQVLSNFTIQKAALQSLHSNPIGGVFTPPMPMVSGTWTSGNIITFPSFTVTNVNPGDSVCFYVTLYDSLSPINNCCHTDTICLVVPPCNMIQPTGCCDSLYLYGDSDDNSVERIKHLNGHHFILSNQEDATGIYGVFSKLDVFGNIIWETQMPMQSQLFDFVEISPGGDFFLVGRTMPVGTSATRWFDNQSLIIKVGANGNITMVEELDNTGREGFFKIVNHPNPPLATHPFYVLGLDNEDNSTTATAQDKAHIYNYDQNLNLNFKAKYDYIQVGGGTVVSTDDEWVGLEVLSNGNLLIMGNSIPGNQRGTLIEVNSTNGGIVQDQESSISNRYRDVLETPVGNMVICGGVFTNGGAPIHGLLILVDVNRNIIDYHLYDTDQIGIFEELEMGANNHIYTTARHLVTGQPYIFEFEDSGSQLVPLQVKYYNEGETAFSKSRIFTDGTVNRLYYADTRTGHPYGYGAEDILYGSFDLMLTDSCLVDTFFSPSKPTYMHNVPSTTLQTGAIPIVTNPIVTGVPPNYSSQNTCPDSIMMCCVDEMQFISDASLTTITPSAFNNVIVDNPLLNECHQITVDWGDGSSTTTALGDMLPFVHQYTMPGTFTVTVNILEIDAAGSVCWDYSLSNSTTVSASNLIAENGIQFFPNPFEDAFKISIENSNHKGFKVEVLDMGGKLMKQEEIVPNIGIKSLNIGGFDSGVYLIRLTDKEGNRVSHRMIKMN